MKQVSLNIDLGELPDESEEFYSLATLVNIACGGHAGDASTMTRAVRLARQNKAKIAAHPSYPDRENFGRKSMKMNAQELTSALQVQINDLARIAHAEEMTICAVKPHGALYHDAGNIAFVAETLLSIVESRFDSKSNLPWALVGPANGALRTLTLGRVKPYLNEGFADRNYLPDGSLVSRTEPNALIQNPEEAAIQALRLAQSGQFDTLCVHGDTPNAIDIARAVRRALHDAHLLEGT